MFSFILYNKNYELTFEDHIMYLYIETKKGVSKWEYVMEDGELVTYEEVYFKEF